MRKFEFVVVHQPLQETYLEPTRAVDNLRPEFDRTCDFITHKVEPTAFRYPPPPPFANMVVNLLLTATFRYEQCPGRHFSTRSRRTTRSKKTRFGDLDPLSINQPESVSRAAPSVGRETGTAESLFPGVINLFQRPQSSSFAQIVREGLIHGSLRSNQWDGVFSCCNARLGHWSSSISLPSPHKSLPTSPIKSFPNL